jgi:hypothetical protein
MSPVEKRQKYFEWGCRIVLTVHFWFCVSGYISWRQAKHQLISPLIPEKTIFQLIEPSFYTSMILCSTFIISLWLHFFKKRLGVIMASSLSVLMYKPLLILFS